MKSHIVSIGTALPPYSYHQQEVADFMSRYLDLDQQSRRWLNKVYEYSGIAYRYSVLPDFETTNEYFLFSLGGKTPSTSERASIFKEEAVKLGKKAAQSCLTNASKQAKEVTHLITVSCTGMYAPGLDIDIIEQCELPTDAERTGINFMGCYAVFNALKTARHITQSQPDAKVLVVAVELCTLHFQANPEKEHLIANALFGDGAGAALVEASEEPQPGTLTLNNFYSQLVPETKNYMTWDVGDSGFEMFLAKSIPDHIQKPAKKTVDHLLAMNHTQYEDLGHLAAHPGGIRILDSLEQELPLPEAIHSASRNVLHKYGNMSSPTILFVLEKLKQDAKGTHYLPTVLSMAFGPGLTIETGLLTLNP